MIRACLLQISAAKTTQIKMFLQIKHGPSYIIYLLRNKEMEKNTPIYIAIDSSVWQVSQIVTYIKIYCTLQ